MVTEAISGSASNAAKSADRNGERGTLDHVQLGMEAATAALHRGVVCGRGHLFILHDDPHGLAFCGSLMGLRQKSRELGRDSLEPATGFAVRILPALSERHPRCQENAPDSGAYPKRRCAARHA